MDKYMKYFKEKESEYYSWALGSCNGAITEIGKQYDLTLQECISVGNLLFISMFTGLILNMEIGNDHISKILKTKEEESTVETKFEQFVQGKLEDKYYKYSLRGQKKDSTLYIAKQNYIKNKKQEKYYKDRLLAKNYLMEVINTEETPCKTNQIK